MNDKEFENLRAKRKVIQNPVPSADFSRLVQLDGIAGNVLVQVRNGYLSTGSPQVNRHIPPNLRRIDDGRWILGLTGEIQKDLETMNPPNAVKHLLRRKDSEPEVQAVSRRRTPAKLAETVCP